MLIWQSGCEALGRIRQRRLGIFLRSRFQQGATAATEFSVTARLPEKVQDRLKTEVTVPHEAVVGRHRCRRQDPRRSPQGLPWPN